MMKVSWDYSSQHMEKINFMFQTTKQLKYQRVSQPHLSLSGSPIPKHRKNLTDSSPVTPEEGAQLQRQLL